MTQLAVIGAGLAGLAAARQLAQRSPKLAITVYEQSPGLGGRATSRQRDGFIFDHGAQYVKAPTHELARLLRDELPAEQLHDIGLPVWVFDRAGTLSPGDPAQNADPKWTYRDGLGRLGSQLAAGLDVRCEQPIVSLRQIAGNQRFQLLGAAGQLVGAADLVLLTPPAPQAAVIIAASEIDAAAKAALLAELGSASYRRCISVALAYPERIARPFYALVNTDRGHPISWLALEHAKAPERCPPSHSLLIAQMAPLWSIQHWGDLDVDVGQLVAPLAAALLGADLGAPLWADLQRWPYALPDSGADFVQLNGLARGLFFAGDYTAGLGRVHLAIESGWRAAAAVEQFLAL